MMEDCKAGRNKKGLTSYWKGSNSFLKGEPSMNNKLLNAILCNTAIEIIKFMSFGKDRHGTMTVTIKMVTECISCGISQDKVQLHQMCRNLCEYTLACQSSLCFYKDSQCHWAYGNVTAVGICYCDICPHIFILIAPVSDVQII